MYHYVVSLSILIFFFINDHDDYDYHHSLLCDLGTSLTFSTGVRTPTTIPSVGSSGDLATPEKSHRGAQRFGPQLRGAWRSSESEPRKF